MDWAAIQDLQDEHETIVAEMEALTGALRELANDEPAVAASEFASLRERAEGFRYAFLVHRLKEEDGLFPEIQKAVPGGDPEAGALGRFFAGEARDDLGAHLEIDGHMRELVKLLQVREQAPALDPEVLARARAWVALAQDLLREHAEKEDTLIFPLMARVLTVDQRHVVEQRLEAFRAGAVLQGAGDDSTRVLVADDDEAARSLMAEALTHAGYRVVLAENGSQAGEALEQGTYSIAVLDWLMPGKDGVTLCHELRQRPRESYVYVILVTGKGDTSDVVTGLNAGADDYLRKPFSVEELRARVRAGERMVRTQQEAQRASQQLVAAALTDEVTGLPNRRAILRRLGEEHRRQAREGRSLSILLADLDDFKQVNDTYGHGAGDRALQEFARRAAAAVRAYDVIGRFGGDEFIIVLPRATESQAVAVGERMRSAVSGKAFELGAAGTHRVAVSCGVAEVEAGLTLEEALAHADRALYAAKSRGGDCVCTPPGPSGHLAGPD